MALIGNYSVLNKLLAQFTNGTSTAGAYAAVTPSNYQKSGMFVNRFGSFDQTGTYPIGYRPPYGFRLALRDGGMASSTQANAALSTTGNLAGGRNLEASSSFTLTVTDAQLDQIVSAVANGTLSFAKLNAILAGAANAGASGTLTFTATSALAGAKFSVTASASGSLSGAGSVLTAIGHMEAEGGGATPLSPEGLAASLLDNEDIETNYSLRESLRLILSSLAGKVSGAGTSTITIRDVNDTVNRIVATVDSNGNRTAVTKDVT